MADLSIDIAGLHFRNPLMPGSGPPGATLNKLRKLEAGGIGALLAKTISSVPADVPKPCMAFDGELFFNIEKWSEIAASEWVTEILPAMQDRKVPLLVSVGYTPEDVAELFPKLDPFVDGYELSTHYRTSTQEQYKKLVGTAKSLTTKPVIMKLSAHAPDLLETARTCEASGADAITAINSIGPVMSIDIEKRSSRLGVDEPYAWLSGPAIKPLAMRAVYDISRTVKLPVIACGGVANGSDVVEFMLAGASVVQSCTTLIRKGPDWIEGALREIQEWCGRHSIVNLKEIIGTVTPHYKSGREQP